MWSTHRSGKPALRLDWGVFLREIPFESTLCGKMRDYVTVITRAVSSPFRFLSKAFQISIWSVLPATENFNVFWMESLQRSAFSFCRCCFKLLFGDCNSDSFIKTFSNFSAALALLKYWIKFAIPWESARCTYEKTVNCYVMNNIRNAACKMLFKRLNAQSMIIHIDKSKTNMLDGKQMQIFMILASDYQWE